MPSLVNAEAGLGSTMLFPIPMASVTPAIGQCFDLVGSQTLPAIAFDQPSEDQLLSVSKSGSKGRFFYVKDSSSFSDAFSFSVSAGGGGWGASYGMTADASALLKTSSLTQTIHYRGVTTERQLTVKPSVALSNEAARVLKQGVAAFTEKYGTHFVAGYIYGKSCNLSYHLEFSTLYLATKFTASFNESESELGFSDSVQASISNALTKSSSSCSYSIDYDVRGFRMTKVPTQRADLQLVMNDYSNAATDEHSPICLVVYPWTYLDVVSAAFGITNNEALTDLTELLNNLIFIVNSTRNFMDSGLYAGGSQLKAVRTVKSTADSEIDQILKYVTQCNVTGDPVTDEAVGKFAPAEELRSEMDTALSRFRISFSITWPKKNVTGYISDELQGEAISGLPVSVVATQGIWYNWSFEGNGNWAGTSGSHAKRHDICAVYSSDGVYAGEVIFVLDSDKGTVQAWCCGANQQLSDNPRSQSTTIRGVVNSQTVDVQDSPSLQKWSAPQWATFVEFTVC